MLIPLRIFRIHLRCSEFLSGQNLAEAIRTKRSFYDWLSCWRVDGCRPHSASEEQLQPLLYTLRLPCRTRSIKEDMDFPTKRWTWESSGWNRCSRLHWEQEIHWLEARETSDQKYCVIFHQIPPHQVCMQGLS